MNWINRKTNQHDQEFVKYKTLFKFTKYLFHFVTNAQIQTKSSTTC